MSSGWRFAWGVGLAYGAVSVLFGPWGLPRTIVAAALVGASAALLREQP